MTLLLAFALTLLVAVLISELAALRGFAESLADLLKFAGLFVFGALLSPHLVADLGAGGIALMPMSATARQDARSFHGPGSLYIASSLVRFIA